VEKANHEMSHDFVVPMLCLLAASSFWLVLIKKLSDESR